MGFGILFYKYNLREINSQMEMMSLHELNHCGFAAAKVGSRCSSFNNLAINRHIFDRKRKNNALSIEKLTIFVV
jgi:hypothetical protein